MIDSFETNNFYRGFSNSVAPLTPILCRTRKDRRPRDMPIELHESADNWFAQRFGIQYRSQAVFVTGSKFIAQNYAKDSGFVARIIPVGDYNFCWSPRNSDLLFLRTRREHVTVESFLDNSEYKELDLQSACASGNEVMLFCDNYIAIPVNLLANRDERWESKILLA